MRSFGYTASYRNAKHSISTILRKNRGLWTVYLKFNFSHFTPQVWLVLVKRKPKIFGFKNAMERGMWKILTFTSNVRLLTFRQMNTEALIISKISIRSYPESDPIQAIRSGSIRVLLTASPGCYSTPTHATNVSVKSKLQHAPPGIPRAFDTFAVPGRREFDYQSLPGGGEFDPHALGVGNLNWTLDFM